MIASTATATSRAVSGAMGGSAQAQQQQVANAAALLGHLLDVCTQGLPSVGPGYKSRDAMTLNPRVLGYDHNHTRPAARP